MPSIIPAYGAEASAQLLRAQKLYIVVRVPVGVILNTVPWLCAPPDDAVPYRFPSVPWIRGAKSGLDPLLPVKFIRVVKVCALPRRGIIRKSSSPKLQPSRIEVFIATLPVVGPLAREDYAGCAPGICQRHVVFSLFAYPGFCRVQKPLISTFPY